MSRASDLLSQLESEVEDNLAEISRLRDEIAVLESDVDHRQATIDEQDEYIEALEATIAFVEAHFPDAIKAYDVRQRMEKASSTNEKAQ
jgi:peptidoglycan hydrolase CwlO-like protein